MEPNRYKRYVVGQDYIDRRDKADEEDQFLRWFNEPLDTGLWVSFGISGLSYTKDKALKKLGRAVIVLVASDHENSYHDIINTGSGAIEYWGDNRDVDKLASDTRGNKIILDALNTIKTQPKELHPIILFFDKRGSGLKGKVRFLGVCNLMEVETTNYSYAGQSVENLLISLQLDKEIGEVFVEDLHERCKGNIVALSHSNTHSTITGASEELETSIVAAPNSNDGWSAERYVAEFFISKGWQVNMVGHKKIGFDLRVSRGSTEYFVEVKSSVSNASPTFTENEVKFWNDYKENYLLAVLENFNPNIPNEIQWVKFPNDVDVEFSTSTTTTYRLSRTDWKKQVVKF